MTIPQLKRIPPPTGRGEDAFEYLKSAGLMPISPTIRASQEERCRACPFLYYLVDRLSLVPAIRWSKALSRGSWFHKRLEFFHSPPQAVEVGMNQAWAERLAELKDLCKAQAVSPDMTQATIDREEKDFKTAWTWFDIASGLPISQNVPSFNVYMKRPYWRFLGSEVGIRHKEKELAPLVGTLDQLYYNSNTNTLWILDAKTCDCAATQRLETCTIELQTLHYIYILRQIIQTNPEILKQWNVPPDVTVGGMIHWAVQKPTIDFCDKDRDWTMDTSPLKSGPRRGLPRMEKIYSGEPKLENYLKRCAEWYKGEGEYANLASKRLTESPVNLSFTYARVLDSEEAVAEYKERVGFISRYARMEPHPCNFPRTQFGMKTSHGKLTDYAPFFVTTVDKWPTIVQQDGFVQAPRDIDLPDNDQVLF